MSSCQAPGSRRMQRATRASSSGVRSASRGGMGIIISPRALVPRASALYRDDVAEPSAGPDIVNIETPEHVVVQYEVAGLMSRGLAAFLDHVIQLMALVV